jgi:hypothetical protein
MFLRLACGRLSPALVQIALANRHDELFDAPEEDFPARAEAVIAQYEAQAEAITETYLTHGPTTVQLRLKKLGWHEWGDFVWAGAKFKPWFADNATVLLAAYKDGTAWAGQIAKPPP